MQYCSELAVFPHLSFTNRMKLSVKSLKFRKYHQRFPYSIKSMRFSQSYGPVNLNGVPEEVGTGELHVESVVFHFAFNEVTNKVKITCSLTPGHERILDDKSASRKYFQHYLKSSKCSVQHLHLVECDRPFRGMTNLRVPSLTWVLNESRQHALFQNFAFDHIFEKLEFVNCRAAALCDRQVLCFDAVAQLQKHSSGFTTRSAKHLLVENRGIYEEFVIGNELTLIAHCFTELKNKLHVIQGFNHMESFIALCIYIEHPRILVGSSFTGRFKPSPYLKHFLWDTLLKDPKASEGHIQGKLCLVSKLRNDFIVAVFQNYFDDDDEDIESFTVLKLERNMETGVDELSDHLEEVQLHESSTS